MHAGFTVVPPMSDCRNLHPAYTEAHRFSMMETQLQSLLKKKHLPLVSLIVITPITSTAKLPTLSNTTMWSWFHLQWYLPLMNISYAQYHVSLQRTAQVALRMICAISFVFSCCYRAFCHTLRMKLWRYLLVIHYPSTSPQSSAALSASCCMPSVSTTSSVLKVSS